MAVRYVYQGEDKLIQCPAFGCNPLYEKLPSMYVKALCKETNG